MMSQPRIALLKANAVRYAGAEKRRQIASLPRHLAREKVAVLLEDPPDEIARMRVGHLLRSIPQLGRAGVRRTLRLAALRGREERRVHELTERQRKTLASTLRNVVGRREGR
jgi:hypothetical protein